MSTQTTLKQIEAAIPANEAEVETKVLLHLFRLLGFTDIDRADKPTVTMYFGHEKRSKKPDFVLYDGPERSLANALVAVEAKAIGEPVDDATTQARSYAAWTGTPFYVVCNGEVIVAVQFIPGAQESRILEAPVSHLSDHWERVHAFLSRAVVILAKERLAYLSCYLPQIETLPPSEFFKEYLNRLQVRFSLIAETKQPLVPPREGQQFIPRIPVTVRFTDDVEQIEFSETAVAEQLCKHRTRLFVQGAPGSGKSTLCKRVADELARISLETTSNVVPIYVSLSLRVPDTISKALEYACSEMGVRFFPNLYKRSLKQAEVVLILDGLDEIGDPHVNDRKLEKLIRQNPEYSFLVTGRPIGAERYLADALGQTFTIGNIRDLTDDELRNVLEEYLGDPHEIEHVLSGTIPALRESLRSPLFALMALRVAQAHPDWTSLSRFRLFEEYVSVLHRFFNADTVRGRGEPVPLDRVLSCLSIIAFALQTSDPSSTTSLDQLGSRMQEEGYEEAFEALINLGLLSSIGGKPLFAHQSFHEFGLARYMIDCIRDDDAVCFTKPRPTETTYELVNSGIGPDEEGQLVQWLSSDDKKVRRRVLGVFRYGASRTALDRIRSLLPRERSIRAWSAAVRTLIAHKDEQFLPSLFTGAHPLSRRKRRILAWALRKSKHSGYLPWALRLAEERKQHAATACAFELALAVDSVDSAERLIDLYWPEKPNQRRALCSILNEYQATLLGQRVILSLVKEETRPGRVAHLLSGIREKLPGMPPEDLAHVCEVLSRADSKNLHRRDRKRLRRIAKILETCTLSSETHQRLLALCRSLGAYCE